MDKVALMVCALALALIVGACLPGATAQRAVWCLGVVAATVILCKR